VGHSELAQNLFTSALPGLVRKILTKAAVTRCFLHQHNKY
jgi:hypothetical protein